MIKERGLLSMVESMLGAFAMPSMIATLTLADFTSSLLVSLIITNIYRMHLELARWCDRSHYHEQIY